MELLPDLRGMFLRGLNSFDIGKVRDDGKEDPDGKDRSAASFQIDMLQEHNHKVSSKTADTGQKGRKLPYRNGGLDGDWQTENYGGSETRPKNVAVYYYIKIN
jgi:hypothetical protein